MDLIKITDLTNKLGLSSRSLRYYEQIGLIESVRLNGEKFRYYNVENIERLKQIIVLRKMQIPIRDILRIYESEDTSVVVETFVNRIRIIDEEVNALSELKQVVNEFLQAMLQNGVTKISALPILYEKMEKRLEQLDENKPISYNELSTLSERLEKPIRLSIVNLPPMRVLSSLIKENPQKSDLESFWRWIQMQGLEYGEPGRHERFEFRTTAGDIICLRVNDNYVNASDYMDYAFEGGLFAAANVYLDEDLGGCFRHIVTSLNENMFYEIDYNSDGSMRCEAMTEDLISPDEKRELVTLYVPVKKRLANVSLFDKPIEDVKASIQEIEAQNPVLWEKNIQMDKLTPIYDPYYRVNEDGEAEYIAWIVPRVLSTNVEVTLPFRVDIEFKVDDKSARFGNGSDEGCIRFYHGTDFSWMFGINMQNKADERLSQEAISFRQPIFGDYFNFPGRGKINHGVYNRLTWIVGEKHFAIIINGEIRYCGINFPYMSADLSQQKPRPIIIGSDGQGKRYFRSIKVSQLAKTQKFKIKEGELTMITKRSSNIIPNIHPLITKHYGENYWFNGCAKYVMECLNEADYDYWFFAGLTGDNFAQVYARDFMGDGVTDYRICPEFIEGVFDKCGYASTFATEKQLRANREMWLQTLIAYIDKGIPVIRHNWCWGVFVGYEEQGKTLLYLTDDFAEPARVSVEELFPAEISDKQEQLCGWIFVGEKKQQKDLKQLYRDVIYGMPSLLNAETKEYCFGAKAFRAWADEIEGGKFDGMKLEDYNDWTMYKIYICNLATNGSCCHSFLEKARNLNPDMAFLDDVDKLYWKMANMWNNQNGEDLEAIGGGFNVTLDALQKIEPRTKIVAKIREFAVCMDEIMQILTKNLI